MVDQRPSDSIVNDSVAVTVNDFDTVIVNDSQQAPSLSLSLSTELPE